MQFNEGWDPGSLDESANAVSRRGSKELRNQLAAAPRSSFLQIAQVFRQSLGEFHRVMENGDDPDAGGNPFEDDVVLFIARKKDLIACHVLRRQLLPGQCLIRQSSEMAVKAGDVVDRLVGAPLRNGVIPDFVLPNLGLMRDLVFSRFRCSSGLSPAESHPRRFPGETVIRRPQFLGGVARKANPSHEIRAPCDWQ